MCKAWDGAMQMYADEAREEMKKQQAEKNLQSGIQNVFKRLSAGGNRRYVRNTTENSEKMVCGIDAAAQK